MATNKSFTTNKRGLIFEYINLIEGSRSDLGSFDTSSSKESKINHLQSPSKQEHKDGWDGEINTF